MTAYGSPGPVAGQWQPVPASAEAAVFVGREPEIASIHSALESARLVTVTGPGGVGKTQLALHAARQAATRYPDGVSFADLSGLHDPELLPAVAAASLGLLPRSAKRQLDDVLDHLSTRRALLVLDTCEHLVDACAMFAETILREAPGVTLLATSRQPLDVAGEHVYSVPPLPVPEPDALPGASEVPGPASLTGTGGAAELFARRAAEAIPGFQVTSGNWADMVRVCRRLDGIPLAIELAAAGLRTRPLRDMADLLDKRYSALEADGYLGDPRHRTLCATIGWSYDLCTEAEQALWARLSVFAGTFDRAAAEEVCAGRGLPREAILKTLVGLVEKSVLVREGERYRMLDTIGEYGAEKLADAGQEMIYRGRHLRWSLAMARNFAEHQMDDDQFGRLRELRTEHANLWAAMSFGLAGDDERLVRDGAALATALCGYWAVCGMLQEAGYWLSTALDRLPAGPSPERAWVLIVRGYLGSFGGRPGQTVADTREGTAMALSLGDNGLLTARGYLYQELALMYDGRIEEAFAAGAEASRRLTALDDRVGLLCLDAQLAHLHALAGQPEAAIEACTRGLRRLGHSNERWVQSYYHILAGLAMFMQGGRERECVLSLNRALAVKYELGDVVGCGYALEILAWISAARSRFLRAAWLLGGASPLWQRAGSRLGGMPIMERLHQEAVAAAREGIGSSRFDETFVSGAACPLDQLVMHAISDADELSALSLAG
jgi:predicted ATPase